MDLTNFKLDLICDISYLNEQFLSLEMIPFDEKEKERLHEAAISFLNGSKKDEAILLKYHQKEFLSYFLQTTSDLEKWVKEKKTFFLGRRRCQFLKFPPSFFLSSF